jgi:hypothetical protein
MSYPWDQRSCVQDDEIVKWFPSSKVLYVSPSVTMSHIWTTYETRIISIDFGVKRPNVLDDEVAK